MLTQSISIDASNDTPVFVCFTCVEKKIKFYLYYRCIDIFYITFSTRVTHKKQTYEKSIFLPVS